MIDISTISISDSSTIEDAIKIINSGAVKIALVINNNNQLLGTLSDGDIRRGFLRKKSLESSIKDIYFKTPITASFNLSKNELLNLCLKNDIEQIPIIDKNNKVSDLYVLNNLFRKNQFENSVILMVGGLGKRLMPLTEITPKPMLNVGGKPILQTIIEGFVGSGFRNITLCLGYKSSVIKDYFNDGSSFGANIDYVIEEKRMGTAGALSLINKKLKKPFFVMNGDLLTNVNYEQMLNFHKSNKSFATMCVREYDVELPYGVVDLENESVVSISEKPSKHFFVNAGIYLLDPDCIKLIPRDNFYDMPTLLTKIISGGKTVTSFPLNEYWIDIGQKSDLKKANIDYYTEF